MQHKKIVFGYHSVLAMLENNPHHIYELLLQAGRNDQRLQDVLKIASLHQIKPQFLHRDKLDKLTEGQVHQGIVAVIKEAQLEKSVSLPDFLERLTTSRCQQSGKPKCEDRPEQFGISARRRGESDGSVLNIHDCRERRSQQSGKPKCEGYKPPLILILDSIQDPRNLGACIRSANAFAVDAVIIPKHDACSVTEVVRKTASGACETTPIIQVTNLSQTIDLLKEQNIWIYGTDAETATSIFDAKFAGGIALVMGAEEKGLHQKIKSHCDFLIKIPMYGSVSSLNVSVATGICLAEITRQTK